MKTPTINWENSSDEFIVTFEANSFENYSIVGRDDMDAVIVSDIARAQRMAAAGLRHLRAILGANRISGKLDRWRRDALAPLYFGRVSRVTQIESVHRRLERAHRRLRDNHLHVRMREKRHASSGSTLGRNTGGFLSPKRFQLFPAFGSQSREDRAATIVHELLHEWIADQKLGDQTVYGRVLAERLAANNPAKARRNPDNYAEFILQVWFDEGLETPSGAERLDLPLEVSSTAASDASGLLADRPVLTPATMGGRRDLVFTALRARSDETMIPAIFEYDRKPIARRGQDRPTGAIGYPAACCTQPDGTVITAVRGKTSKRLRLIAWDVDNEASERLDDSGNLFGDVYSQPDIIALGGGRLCLVFKMKDGRMRINLVEFARGHGFERIAEAETTGPINDHARVCLVSPVDEIYGAADNDAPNSVLVATAFRTREGLLSVDLWSGEFGSRRIRRHGGLVDRKMTGRPAIASLGLGGRPRVVAAVRDDATGRLRLTAYDVSDRQRPRRLGDTGNMGPRMSHSPDMVAVVEGFSQQVATAIRYSQNGRIIVSTWSIPDDSDSFIRERHSGSQVTPEIESTPSLVSIEGQQSEDLLTASIGKNGRLSLQLWSEPQPVRVNG